MNWQIGKARCRSDEYEAEIGIVDETGIYGRYRFKSGAWRAGYWNSDGLGAYEQSDDSDLIPPRLTLEEAARECVRAYYDSGVSIPSVSAMLAALQHFKKLQEEGRV